MTPTWKRTTITLAALVLTATTAGLANAQWTVAYYQPTAYTSYYSPAAAYPATSYYSYYSGWYPGYWLNRTSAWFWGRPRTYVAAYPSTYYASYPSTYAASYPSSYVASYPSSYVTSYPSSYSVGYSSCSGCAVSQVTMRPVCTTACQPTCTSCSTCETVQQVGTYSDEASRPSMSAETEIGPRSLVRRPVVQGPDSADAIDMHELNRKLDEVLQRFEQQEQQTDQRGTLLEAPELFNPKDSTVQRSPAPVRTAVYARPAGPFADRVPTKPITRQHVPRSASGWTSASE